MSDRTTAQQRRVWQTFLLLNEAVRRELARDLWQTSRLSETDFTVLARLAAAPEQSMRSTECARALDWDSGRMSHHLRRMQERGLIGRGPGADGDGRAAVVTLTDEGRSAYRRALGPHWRSAKLWFLDGIDPEDLDRFDATLQKIFEHFHRAQDTAD